MTHAWLTRLLWRPSRVFLVTLACVLLLGACQTPRPKFPEPLRAPAGELVGGSDRLVEDQNTRTSVRGNVTLTLPEEPKPDPALTSAIRVPQMPAAAKPVAIVLDGVPLSVMIDVVYANELKFPVSIDKSVRDRSELVTLRIAQAQAPAEVYRIAAEVLRNYGVVVSESGGVLRFYSTITSNSRSSVATTRNASGVPGGSMVFVAVPMQGRAPGAVAAQLRTMYGQSSGLTVNEVPDANAIMLNGSADVVRDAVNAINELDASGKTRRGSVRIEPQFVAATVMAKELKDLLRAQGYSIKENPQDAGALTFVMLGSSNQLMVFGESRAALEATAYWAEQIDQPSNAESGIGGAYVYSPRHTTVQSLLPVLAVLLGGNAPDAAATPGAPGAKPPTTPAVQGFDGGAGSTQSKSGGTGASASAVMTVTGPGGQLVADSVRNMLVFQGDAQRWRSIQAVLARLDLPTRQVVIEVTVAEVSLTDEYSHGIEWTLRNINLNGMSGPMRIMPGTSAVQGLVWTALSSTGQVQAALNLFAKDSRVTILSTPRIMVKSGEHASIEVGDEVPVITSQATAADLPITGGTSSILQQVQYRKTGVLLDVQANVHSSQRVDLVIQQEVSQASLTDTSRISSPTIKSRKAKTSLTLADGQSMLLGGLISSNKTQGKSKVPLLGDLPVVGQLFQNRRDQGGRTELLMLITPYIISDEAEGRAITEAARVRFETGKPALRAEQLMPPPATTPVKVPAAAPVNDPAVKVIQQPVRSRQAQPAPAPSLPLRPAATELPPVKVSPPASVQPALQRAASPQASPAPQPPAPAKPPANGQAAKPAEPASAAPGN